MTKKPYTLKGISEDYTPQGICENRHKADVCDLPHSLLELAARCEQATGPDRKLDYGIFCACVPIGERACWEPDNQENHFTASLDAAMTLVDLEEGTNGRAGHAFYPYIDRVTHDLGGTHQWIAWVRHSFGRWTAEAATPALALCAAALRARAQGDAA